MSAATRSCAELIDFAFSHPDGTLLAITLAEAQQYIPGVERTRRPVLLVGRPALIIDLPPHGTVAGTVS